VNTAIKQKPLRDDKYLRWVKSLPSVVSGRQADDPHHLIGHGQSGMGTKVTDYWTFPLTRDEHTELHNMGYKEWEKIYGEQWKFVAQTMYLAKIEGVL
jgi:hypothetical protein